MSSDQPVRISSSLYATVNHDNDTDNDNDNHNHHNQLSSMNVHTIESSESIELTTMAQTRQNGNGNGNGNDSSTAPPPPPQTTNSNPNSSKTISFSELNYGMSSYHAIVAPVTFTMILSALAVTFLISPVLDTSADINRYYNALKVSDDYTASRNLGYSVVNALIIVCVIAVATFGLVLLYKFRCMKCLFGYMILSSALLLGLLGNVMAIVAIQRYSIIIDMITFYFLLYNFAIVGTTSIFFPRGIPFQLTQCYLVATSVILAWQLAQFNEWTAWCLLVALAFYDLCAVLTPCGPLKALIGLMSKDGAPDLPGLIFEAKLPEGVKKPKRGGNGNGNEGEDEDGTDTNGGTNAHTNNSDANANGNANAAGQQAKQKKMKQKKNARNQSATGEEGEGHQEQRQAQQRGQSSFSPPEHNDEETMNRHHHQQEQGTSLPRIRPAATTANFIGGTTAQLPLAIALIYRLPIQSPAEFAISHEELAEISTMTARDRRSQYTPKQLKSDVIVQFSRSGGTIEAVYPEENANAKKSRSFFRRKKNSDPKPEKYIVYDRHRNVRRVLVVEDDGKVFEEQDDDGPSGALSANTIKLGLGDFIFYSVLVAKAAQYSFTTFAACTLVILAGLGGTLVLLSVYGKALPALPISIFLGVSFYFLTRVLIEPYLIHIMFEMTYYV